MNGTTTLVAFTLLCFFVWILQKLSSKWCGLPPGPFRFPLIGSVIQIVLQDSTFPFIAMQKLGEYYGNLFYIQVGIVKMANGYEAASLIYQSDDVIGRIDEKWVRDRSYGQALALVAGSPAVWRETRRVSTRNLREFGFGIKNKMEYMIQEELDELCAYISNEIEQTNGILCIKGLFSAPTINVVWSMVSGTRFCHGDRKLEELQGLTEDYTKSSNFCAGPLAAYPFLADYAPKLTGFNKQRECNRGIQKYMENVLAETRSHGEYLTNPSNFIEVYLQKVDTRKINGTLDDTVYSEKNLVSILYDFFIAGSETTSNTLEFGILALVLNPDVQKRIQDEIDTVIGDLKKPSLSDKEKMVYTEATILEISRISAVIPISPRKTVRDTTIGKFKIPKGTGVLINLYSVAMDKEFWGDPENFRPERFLDSSGKLVHCDRALAFGAGKRNCIGESIAKSEIFMMLTGLLQKFSFSLNPSEKKPSLGLEDRDIGFTLSQKPYSVIVSPRK